MAARLGRCRFISDWQLEVPPRCRHGAAIVTIGSSQRGSATDSAGAASALRSPSVQTKWRADADARRSAAATSAVTARIDGRLGDGVEDDRERDEIHGLGSALPRRVDHPREAIQFRL